MRSTWPRPTSSESTRLWPRRHRDEHRDSKAVSLSPHVSLRKCREHAAHGNEDDVAAASARPLVHGVDDSQFVDLRVVALCVRIRATKRSSTNWESSTP